MSDVEGKSMTPQAHQEHEAEVPDPNGPESPRRMPYPGTEGAPTEAPGDMSHMVQIKSLIDDLTAIHTRFGNTCVYVRRRGLSWGAVALNYRSDDEKHGVFDLQAKHDRAMLERVQQIERLIADRDANRDARWALEKEIEPLRLIKSRQPPVLTEDDAAFTEDTRDFLKTRGEKEIEGPAPRLLAIIDRLTSSAPAV